MLFPYIEDDRKIVDVDDDIIIEETKFKCGFCNSKFSSFATLKMHVSNFKLKATKITSVNFVKKLSFKVPDWPKSFSQNLHL